LRKSRLLLVTLFGLAALNRETTLFLIPFYLLGELAFSADDENTEGPSLPVRLSLVSGLVPAVRRVRWRKLLRADALIRAGLMLAYWVAWHIIVFHLFRHNASEYYPRFRFNLYCFRRLRYWPQLVSACGYLLPLLPVLSKKVCAAQLRRWMWMIPV
jgi:hypothetical protein